MADSDQSKSTPPRKSGRGGYRPGAGRKPLAWHQAHAGEETDAQVERRRRRAIADRREIETAALAGRLVDRAQVDAELQAIAAEVWAGLERLPDALCEPLAAESDAAKIHKMLDDELRRVATDMSKQLGVKP